MVTEVKHAIRTAAGWSSMSAPEQAEYAGYYESLSAWDAAQARNLVAADEIAIAECFGDWPGGLDDQLTQGTWTVNATNYVVIRSAAGHAPTGKKPLSAVGITGFYIKRDVNASLLSIGKDYTKLESIGVYNPRSSQSYTRGIFVAANHVVCDGLVLEGARNQTIQLDADGSRVGRKVRNCIAFVKTNCAGFTTYRDAEIHNNGVISLDGTGTGYSNPVPVFETEVRNNFAYNCAVSYSSGFGHANSSNNAASDAATNTPPGSSPITTNIVAGDFADEANDDYSLASGSTLIGAGADLSSSFTTDITGATRTVPWDVGAFMYVAGGGAVAQQIDLQWGVRQLINQSANLQWGVLNTVSQSSSLQWALLNAVSNNTDLRWGLLSLVNQTSDLRWDILAALGVVGQSVDLQWDMLQKAAQSTDLRWRILSLVFKDTDLRWGLINNVSQQADLRYALLANAAQTIDLQWDTLSSLASVSNSVDLRWDILAYVSQSLDAQWSTLELVSTETDLQWQIAVLVSKDADLQWALKQSAGQAVDIRWDVIAKTSQSIDLRWSIISDNQFTDITGVITLRSNTPIITLH